MDLKVKITDDYAGTRYMLILGRDYEGTEWTRYTLVNLGNGEEHGGLQYIRYPGHLQTHAVEELQGVLANIVGDMIAGAANE